MQAKFQFVKKMSSRGERISPEENQTTILQRYIRKQHIKLPNEGTIRKDLSEGGQEIPLYAHCSILSYFIMDTFDSHQNRQLLRQSEMEMKVSIVFASMIFGFPTLPG
jgi:hypothetical protein